MIKLIVEAVIMKTLKKLNALRRIFINRTAKWRLIWRVILGVGVFLAINVPLQEAIKSMFDTGLSRSNLSSTAVLFSAIGSLYAQVRFFDKSTYEKYGFELGTKWFREFAFGCFVAAFQISFFFVLLYALGHLTIVNQFVVNGTEHSFLGGFFSEMYRQLTVGIFEEFVFRAFLFFIFYEMLKSFKLTPKFSVIVSCVFNSLIFGILHLENDGATWLSALNLSIDASTLILPFLLTGRLGMSIGMHFSWNFVQGAIFGFANSGEDVKASILKIALSNHPITGGEFGPEGSTILLVLSTISFLFIYFWKRWNHIKTWLNPKLLTYGVNHIV